MKDYRTKKVYLGIDVHKKTYAVTAICEGITVKKASIQASPEGLVAFCNKYFPGASIESAYEAGFSGFRLHRVLVANGINNRVIHAAGLEVASGDRVKTDKRDSLKLATQLAAGRLKGIHVPSIEREEKRAITRMRDSLVEHRGAVANQIKSFLYYHGHNLPNEGKISSRFIKNLRLLQLESDIRYSLDILLDLWEYLTLKINELRVQMALQAERDQELEKVYTSTPGIGAVSARVLANELEDMAHFENERQLFSYTGLTPSEHSSGGHVRRGHISRQGKPIVRKMLVLGAWKAIKLDPLLKATFDRISLKAGAKKAIIAIARRLLGHIRACFKNKCLYRTAELVKAA